MSWLEFLGWKSQPDSSESELKSLRTITEQLDRLEPDQAKYLAAFAFTLSRVANADLDISDSEVAKMEEIVRDFGELSAEQALLVVQIAKTQNTLFGGTDNFLVTRELTQLADTTQRRELLVCLFAVAAADDSVSVAEEESIRGIAKELGLTHDDYIAARSLFSEKRAVFKKRSS